MAEGVVLIGDAAGYENPLEGQGLSMALQDVHDVSAALLADSGLTSAFEAYAAARAIRQRLANLGVSLQVWANNGFNTQDPHERASRYDHIRNDDVLAALEVSFMTGFDSLPQDLTHTELAARLATPAT
jgi:2-polyprenyl-6-methoxyphenol hydroxylase-like FAD-dependent oxidoreductase